MLVVLGKLSWPLLYVVLVCSRWVQVRAKQGWNFFHTWGMPSGKQPFQQWKAGLMCSRTEKPGAPDCALSDGFSFARAYP